MSNRFLVFIILSCSVLTFHAQNTAKTFTLKDTIIQINSILTSYAVKFDTDKAILLPGSYPFLDSLADLLIKKKNLQIEVRTFVDNHSNAKNKNAKSDLDLEYAQVQTVIDYLI